LQRAIWAIKIQSLDAGDLLYTLNPDTLVMPASNMKIVTLAVAAERLGWDYRFQTRLETTAPIARGALLGDLVVVGGGDPSLNSRNGGEGEAVFDEFATALREVGVSRIDGRIVGDARAFAGPRWGFGWSWDDFAYGYQAPIGALQFNESTVQVSIRPGRHDGDLATIEIDPAADQLAVVDNVLTGPSGSDVDLDLFRFPGRPELEVRGTIPLDHEPVTRDAAVQNPTLFFVRAFRDALLARGIEVRGEAVDIDEIEPGPPASSGYQSSGLSAGTTSSDPDSNAASRSGANSPLPPAGRPVGSELRGRDGSQPAARTIASRPSPPLSDIARRLMKASQNLYAETVLRAISLVPGPASLEASQRIATDVLTCWGIPPDAYVIADGSGLSRHNLVTASTIVRLLQVMARSPQLADAFEAALPVAGRDGTLSSRMKASRAEGNVKAKTGSLLRVRALSGYLRTADGERLVFSIIANHFSVPSGVVDATVDQALELLVNFSRKATTAGASAPDRCSSPVAADPGLRSRRAEPSCTGRAAPGAS
jgi:D-alanyl-D-alanine carboxypeptidase/D-alanyl-D-alanine-endopeptidase (penicillin-binding protein 4)